MKKLLLGLTLTVGITGLVHAAGDPVAGEQKAAVCAACHGANGVSMVPNWPNLAGQGFNYLVKQTIDIRDGRRAVPEMVGIVDNLSDQDIRDIAAFYRQQPANLGQADPALAERGRDLYRAGDLAKGIPACTACHLPNGGGNGPAAFPAVSGQHPTYAVNQLKAFRNGTRDNDPNAMMRLIAEKMSDAEMEAVASYMYGLHGTNR
ncbi:c-type cytochrome [Marinospirillum alkaliphilum]|uniref:Cytochrome c553 n=1 Tax=Marinospirillum alkaliphilum DSM 21637 TaxID=1122209 RepID=A0A1K1Y3U8_9GAMM|nr:c-type cytochrome [Marinospirillum alkaliphilum]SFX56705.1 Cytochrome c553 [Marinospirillum alkaliphilum DSM 21637]